MRNVWAIGDLTSEPMLAHRAMAHGEMVAEIISGSWLVSCPVETTTGILMPRLAKVNSEIGLQPRAICVKRYQFRSEWLLRRAKSKPDDAGYI